MPDSETFVAIVPDAAKHREQIARAIRASGATAGGSEVLSKAAVAVVDLVGPAAGSMPSFEGQKIPILAVIDLEDPSMIGRAKELGAVDFVAESSIDRELPIRLRGLSHNAVPLQSVRFQAESEKRGRIAAEDRATDLQRYQEYFAQLSDGIAILDGQGNLLSLNPAGAKLLGLEALQEQERNVQSLTQPPGDRVIGDVLRAIARGEPAREVDLPARTKDGRARMLSVAAAPLVGGNAILSFRDVTAARELAGELKRAKDFLERLINSSVDAIIAADMRGKIILFNRGAEAISGYSEEEALKRLNVKDLYPPGVAREVMLQLRDPQIRTRGRLGVCRQQIVTKSGDRVPVNMTASILYEDDRETATVGIFTDLRDRMQLERKLSDAELRLEETEKTAVIVELAGTAAHELNQPLTSVMGYADLLKRKLKEDDFAYRPVDIIYREAERMAEIVRKIGKITRYETKSYIGTAKILDLDKASSHED